jgi:hypothetical protein
VHANHLKPRGATMAQRLAMSAAKPPASTANPWRPSSGFLPGPAKWRLAHPLANAPAPNPSVKKKHKSLKSVPRFSR